MEKDRRKTKEPTNTQVQPQPERKKHLEGGGRFKMHAWTGYSPNEQKGMLAAPLLQAHLGKYS